MVLLPQPIAFEWDKGNENKNVVTHSVTNQECEEVFFDRKKKILKDILHSKTENRYVLIGTTKPGRKLFIAFTIRGKNLRIISARDLNKKELHLYEKET